MIVASLLLILVAVVMLTLGLLGGANGYLVGSIVASLFAAIALVVSGRRATWGAEAPWRRGVDRPAPGSSGRADDDLAEPALAETELVAAGARSVPAARAEAVPLGLVTVGGLGHERRPGPLTGSGGARSGDAPVVVDHRPADADEDRVPAAGDRGTEPDGRADAVDDSLTKPDAEPAPAHPSGSEPVDDEPAASGTDDVVVADERAADDEPAAGERVADDEPAAREPGSYEPATDDEPAVRDQSVTDDEPAAAADRDGAATDAAATDAAATDGDDDAVDEPPVQLTPPGDAARVARADTEVHVIDGRPRYHLRRCVHLLGRSSEPLPAHEAVALGFTPCALCEPDTWIAAQARSRA